MNRAAAGTGPGGTGPGGTGPGGTGPGGKGPGGKGPGGKGPGGKGPGGKGIDKGGGRCDLDAAERMGIAALGFLAEDASRLGHFLALTGLGPAELMAEAGSPRMLAAVLEHMLGDEALLLAFAANHGIAPDSVVPAWDALVYEAASASRS